MDWLNCGAMAAAEKLAVAVAAAVDVEINLDKWLGYLTEADRTRLLSGQFRELCEEAFAKADEDKSGDLTGSQMTKAVTLAIDPARRLAMSLCAENVPNRPAIIACMHQHREQLSARCGAVFDEGTSASSSAGRSHD